MIRIPNGDLVMISIRLKKMVSLTRMENGIGTGAFFASGSEVWSNMHLGYAKYISLHSDIIPNGWI